MKQTKAAAARARQTRWLALDDKLTEVCDRRGLPTLRDPANFFSIHLDADTYEALLDELLSLRKP